MSGIYVHVPFCRRKCFYCGFYSVACHDKMDAYVESILREMTLRKDYLGGDVVSTLYFGGGTPSLLSFESLSKIIQGLRRNFVIKTDAEITLEANPEDVDEVHVEYWIQLGINRLSLGVQSFNDDILKVINRRHTSSDAVNAIKIAQSHGFSNISLDLIIGLPLYTDVVLKSDVERAMSLGVQHISVYTLSIEEGSAYEQMVKSGKLIPCDADKVADYYLMVSDMLRNNGFEHYEISNYAKANFRSQHNSSYWRQQKYIGLGPAAHSYNLASRQWNVSNINEYVDCLNGGKAFFEIENLSDVDRYNEYIMTRLRTSDGLDLLEFAGLFGPIQSDFTKTINSFIEQKRLVREGSVLSLTEDGFLVSDLIFSSLFRLS